MALFVSKKKKAEIAFEKQGQANQQKKKLAAFCEECSTNVKNAQKERDEYKARIMEAFAAGDETEAKMLCMEMSISERILKVWRDMSTRARRAQMHQKYAESIGRLEDVMNGVGNLMNTLKGGDIIQNLDKWDNMLDAFDNQMDVILKNSDVQTSEEANGLFNKFKDEFEKTAGLDTIGATVAEVPFTTLKSDNNTKIGE